MMGAGPPGSGKTMLLAALYRALKEAGVEIVSGDWEGKRRKDRRTLAMASTTGGLWVSADAGEHWHCASQDLPPVAALAWVPA